jgi:hypothetical protein
MANEVIISLDKLNCISQSDVFGSPSEPYMWTFVAWLEENGSVHSRTQRFEDVRILIKDGIRPGNIVDIPFTVGKIHLKFQDIKKIKSIVVVLAILEENQTSENDAKDGLQEFNRILFELLDAPTIEIIRNLDIQIKRTAELLAIAIEEINEAEITRLQSVVQEFINNRKQLLRPVSARVVARAGDKMRTFIPPQDTFVGEIFSDSNGREGSVDNALSYVSLNRKDFPSQVIPIENQSIETVFQSDRNHYVINGRVIVKSVPNPPIDLCRGQAQAVTLSKRKMDSIKSEIKSLQSELRNASSQNKPRIRLEIEALENNDLEEAETQLKAANKALAECRNRPRPDFGISPASTINVIGTQ